LNTSIVHLPIKTEGLGSRREVVLAEAQDEPNCYLVRSIPAFVYGLASGDSIRMLDRESGRYELCARGGQVTVRVFVGGSLDRPDVRGLIDRAVLVGGTYEVARNDPDGDGASLLLLSVDVRIGFAEIESMIAKVEGPDVRWEYGNVYDEDGASLNWWTH
jgi:hypothetical protein